MPKITGGSHWSSLGVAGKQDGSWVKTSTEGQYLLFDICSEL